MSRVASNSTHTPRYGLRAQFDAPWARSEYSIIPLPYASLSGGVPILVGSGCGSFARCPHAPASNGRRGSPHTSYTFPSASLLKNCMYRDSFSRLYSDSCPSPS